MAIWLEASLHQWEAAAALAHARAAPRLRTPRRPPAPHHAPTAPAPAAPLKVATATNFMSSQIWDQWLALETLRGGDAAEAALRLRALASAASVRLGSV